MIWARHR